MARFFEPVCKHWGVPLVVSRGYTSFTYRQEALRRLQDWRDRGRLPVLLYFGDLDPSGWDIWRMLRDELSPVQVDLEDGLIHVTRV